MSSTDLEKVESHSWQTDPFTLDIEGAKTHESVLAIDYYEILRVGPQADEETIERVYNTLADRFHPDNPSTGDPETFLRLGEAYETLSNPVRRAKYNALRQGNGGSARFWLRGREFFDGVRGGQNRRLAVLCLLYRQRITTHEWPGLTVLDLERLTGCTREEIASALWYLCEKKWGLIGESTAYSITADGFDVVESKLEDRLEFRALATVCYYRAPAELNAPAGVEPRFWKDTLPLYLEPARTTEGDVFIADHYEILGIGSLADEEVIERVFRTLAGRFHPDNPGTGDATTFLRIREAYDTLSNQARRAEYDALRRRTKHSSRFRLRGREFFDGIKGEHLRRLAVLCLLYRQTVSDSPGLTVLDLEQLTGCTREELGSALWYLREKKWARSGEYTEYSITAAGFDIVESAAQTAAQSQPSVPVTLQSPISDTIAPENRYSHWIAESEPTGNREAVQSPIPIAQPPGPAAQDTPAAQIAGSEQTETKAEEPPKDMELIAEQVTGFEDENEPEDRKAAGSWAWLCPEDICGDELGSPHQASNTVATGQAVAEQPAAPSQPDEPSQAVPPSQPNVEVTPQSTGVIMSNAENAIAQQAGGVAVGARQRVILSMGGKGGVGKTSVMTGLAEWFEENRIPVTLLDLDVENKARGSLTHFFGGRVPKINIHTPAGLDTFVDQLAEGTPAILADMGAGAGQITHDWFEKMYPDATDIGIVFTAIGVVTSDPASVESVLNWATALQHRVNYVIAENNLTEHTDFTYWRENVEAQEFRKRFEPAIIRLDYRLADLENAVRNYGVTLGQVAGRTASAPELQKASLVMRAQSYRRRMFAEFDRVKELLLP